MPVRAPPAESKRSWSGTAASCHNLPALRLSSSLSIAPICLIDPPGRLALGALLDQGVASNSAWAVCVNTGAAPLLTTTPFCRRSATAFAAAASASLWSLGLESCLLSSRAPVSCASHDAQKAASRSTPGGRSPQPDRGPGRITCCQLLSSRPVPQISDAAARKALSRVLVTGRSTPGGTSLAS